jgi:serine/threonine protein kinase
VGDSSNDETRISNTDSGWLSQSGSIDHGRFTPGAMLDNRYRIVGLLGRGGMGEVYRADDLRLGQPVAIKLLPSSLGNDPKRLAQFHSEVRTARQVSHPNVCRVHDIGEVPASPGSSTANQLFITMEYVDGEDLAASLKRVGRFPEDKAIELARQISAGLAAAHDRGIIHRDLKPANIMLDKEGRVRLMDFGLAAAGTVDDVRSGTPAYMAPEQLDGTSVSIKSDIYSLGLVLYELFTGKRAYNAKTLQELVDQHAAGSITPPTALVKNLDPAIEAALIRCLDRNPDFRPASALAVSAALPGGDPLAAAIAAGETPSPEMVAAAGESSTHLPVSISTALTVAGFVLIIAIAWLCDQTSLIPKLPLQYAPSTLADRARDLEKQFGFSNGNDRATSITTRDDVIAWLRRENRHEQLAAGGGPVSLVNFWYRSSLNGLIPYGNPVTPTDPVGYQPGMTYISMDAAGKLLAFNHAPTSADATDAAAAPPPPWDTLFAAAGFDRSKFTETKPKGALRLYADARAAWTGTLPGMDDVPIRVEAASFHGKPVLFTVLGPWNDSAITTSASAEPTAPDRTTQIVAMIASFIVVPGVIIGAALVARANVRSGRSDRRGAKRIGGAVLAVSLIGWLFNAQHFASPGLEISRFLQAVGLALFDAFLVWLFYLAAEPRVRKVWPHILITWSRLLSGSVKDPLIGRDLLVGAVVGLLMTAVSYAFYLLPPVFGWEPLIPGARGLRTLDGTRAILGSFSTVVNNAIQNAMTGVVGLALLRGVIKREWIAFVAASLIFAPLAARGQFQSGIAWFDLLFGLMLVVLILGVLFRFGLFAGIVGFTTHFWTYSVPLTLDSTRQYFSASVFALAIISTFIVLGVALTRIRKERHAGSH